MARETISWISIGVKADWASSREMPFQVIGTGSNVMEVDVEVDVGVEETEEGEEEGKVEVDGGDACTPTFAKVGGERVGLDSAMSARNELQLAEPVLMLEAAPMDLSAEEGREVSGVATRVREEEE